MTSDIPSNQLNFEVLGEIFGHLIAGHYGTLELRAVLLVSRSWNAAAIQHPHLWTSIKLNVWFYAHFYELGAPVAALFVRSCLERSAALHFDLVLNFEDLYCPPKPIALSRKELDAWVSRAAEQARNVLKVLAEHIIRCKSLALHLSYPMNIVFVLSYFPATLDQLKFLSINKFDYVSRYLTLRELPCPALEHVSYSNLGPGYRHFIPSESLKVLELYNDHYWADTDLAPISAWSRSIRILKLRCAAWDPKGNQFGGHDEEPKEPIALTNLETLEIEGLVPRGFLALLRAPMLRHLYIRSYDAHREHSMAELVSTLVHKHARTLLVELNSRPEVGWETVYNNLVVDMPNLEDARVVVKGVS